MTGLEPRPGNSGCGKPPPPRIWPAIVLACLGILRHPGRIRDAWRETAP